MNENYMNNEEAMKICRKKKPSGRDVGRLFLYRYCMDLLSRYDAGKPIDKEVLDPKVSNKLALFKTQLFTADRQAGIDNEAGELGIYTDHEYVFSYVEKHLQTALAEYWRAVALGNMARVTVEKIYIQLKYKGTENPLFEEVTETEFSQFKYIVEEGIEASAYYVNAFNRSLDLLTERYKIDLSNLKVDADPNGSDIKGVVGILQNRFRVLCCLFNNSDNLTEQQKQIHSFIDKNLHTIDYEKITAIPADREEKAQKMLKNRLPFFNGSMNKILCVFQKKNLCTN